MFDFETETPRGALNASPVVLRAVAGAFHDNDIVNPHSAVLTVEIKRSVSDHEGITLTL